MTRKTPRIQILFKRRDCYGGISEDFNKTAAIKRREHAILNQQQIIAEIVLKFDDPSYSDNNKSSREFISQKMIEMQESGAPPQELVGDLAEGVLPGTGAPSDGPGDCPVQ